MQTYKKKSVKELLQINRGITSLLSVFLADTGEEFSNDVLFDIFRVIGLQVEIQNEIESRLPFKILESTSNNREEVPSEKAK